MKVIHVCAVAATSRYFLRSHLVNLSKLGYEVFLVCGEDDKDEEDYLAQYGIHFVHVPINRDVSPVSDLLSLWRLVRLYLKIRPNVVHTHTPKASLLGTLAARLTNVKNIIFHCHGLVYVNCNIVTSRVGVFIECLPILFSHKSVAVSKSLATFIEQKGFNFRKNIFVIGDGSICGVDTDVFSPSSGADYDKGAVVDGVRKQTKVRIGYLGRLNRDKGVDSFVQVVSQLHQHDDRVEGLLAGPIEDFDVSCLPKYITYHDEITNRARAAAFLRECNIFLFLSKREGFGLAVAEASASSTAVVASRIFGISDVVVDGRTGVLVDTNDLKSVANVVLDLINNRTWRDELGRKGREHIIKKFRKDRVEKEFVRFYENIPR